MDTFSNFMPTNNGYISSSNDGPSYDVFGSGNLESVSTSNNQFHVPAPSLFDRQGNPQGSQSAQDILRNMVPSMNFGSGVQFGDCAASAPSFIQNNNFVGTPDNLSTGSGGSARRVSEPESRRNSTITMGMPSSNKSRCSMISSTSNSNFNSLNNSGGGFFDASSGNGNDGCDNFNNSMPSTVMNRLANAASVSGQGDNSLMMNSSGLHSLNNNNADASFPNFNNGPGNLRNFLSNNSNLNTVQFANSLANFNFNDGSNFSNTFSTTCDNDMINSNQIVMGTNTNMSMVSPIVEAPLVIPPKKTKNKLKQTFAQKLMHILSIKECQNAIRWMPDGISFCIVDSKALVDKVLPAYFKEAKYTSFTRKLNRWGFKHFTLPSKEGKSETSVYTHPKFQRDCPELCQNMDGGHRRRSSASRASGISTISTSGSASSQAQLGGNMQQGQCLQDIPHQYSLQQQLHLQEMIQQEQQNRLLNPLSVQGGASDSASDIIFGNLNINGNLLNSFQNSAFGGNNPAMAYLPSSNRRDSGFASFGGDNNHTSGNGPFALSNIPVANNRDEFDQFTKASFSNFTTVNDNNHGNSVRNADLGKMPFDDFSPSMAAGRSSNYDSVRQGNNDQIDNEHDAHFNALRDMLANESHRMMFNFDSKPSSQG